MVYIIAEIGINHNGHLSLAKQLIEKAKEAGADAIKFQKRVVAESFTRQKLDEPYLTKNSWGRTYGLHKYVLEFSETDMRSLASYAESLGIDFICTGGDISSIDFIDTIPNLKYIKVASGDLTNLPMLTHIANKNKPFILSTGMSNLEQIKTVVNTLDLIHLNFSILSCTSTYPTPLEDIHLNNIDLFKKEFPLHTIGYSGHEVGFLPTLGAVAKGAEIIERHITLSKTMRGSDHKGSLEPSEFADMVTQIRQMEACLGSSEKNIRTSELPFKSKLTKSVCARVPILKNQVLQKNMLTMKHPGTGISGLEYNHILGYVATRDIPEDTILTRDDISFPYP